MKHVVSYLMSGAAHLHYLIPSLYTLRNHYDGEVEVWAYTESYPLVCQIADDPRLNIRPLPWKTDYYGKNSQFLNKILMCQRTTCDVRLYLDADTTIHGSLMPLIDMCQHSELNLTQFNHWLTNGRVIRARIKRLLEFEQIDSEKVNDVLTNPYPSPNGGIFSTRPTAEALPHWYEWSWLARDVFICDEAVLQVLQRCYTEKQLTVLQGGKFNCSHKYGRQISKPAVFHYHGNSCTRPDKSPRACDMWWPLYEYCIEQNFGNIQRWRKQVPHKWMDRLKEHPRYSRILA